MPMGRKFDYKVYVDDSFLFIARTTVHNKKTMMIADYVVTTTLKVKLNECMLRVACYHWLRNPLVA